MFYVAGGLRTACSTCHGAPVTEAGGISGDRLHQEPNKYHFDDGGVEYAMTNNIFLGVEYRYFDLGSETYNLGAFAPGRRRRPDCTTVDLKASEVQARLNIKLNGFSLFGM